MSRIQVGFTAFRIFSVLALAEATDRTNGNADAVKNVALHKKTLLSISSRNDSGLAVDGNRDQYVANGSCINIEKKGDSWLQVDLGDIYTIFHVKVFLAHDCCDEKVVEEKDCNIHKQPWTYRGRVSTTVNNKTCKVWELSPNTFIDETKELFTFRDRGVWSVEKNYCRGVGFRGRFKPWCYTTDPKRVYPDAGWEYCDIEQCEPVIKGDLDLKTGTRENSMKNEIYRVITDDLQHVRYFVFPANTRTRYLQFHQDGTTDYFPLCEVEVYGTHDKVSDVAFRKPVQTSTLVEDQDPNLVVNGTADGCFHTAKEHNPWWRVDLADIYVIVLVRIYVHVDCYNKRTHDILLRTGKSEHTMVESGWTENEKNEVQNFVLPINTEARFVELSQTAFGVFHLSKVEVFGKIALSLNVATNGTSGTEDAVTNVALHKKTLQSTLSIYDSSLAVDGNTDQFMANESCININKKGDSWLEVDLGDIYTVFHVRALLAKDFSEEKIVEEVDCYTNPRTYQGEVKTTDTRKACQPWESIFNNWFGHHTFQHYFFEIKSGSENFCRGLGDRGNFKPWCFTTGTNTTTEEPEWDYCLIEQCEPVITEDLNLKTGSRENALMSANYIRIIDEHVLYFVLPATSSSTRYLQFQQDGTRDYYPICEVEVYGTNEHVINVALGKKVYTSTVNPHLGNETGRTVDGILSQNVAFDLCFHTDEEHNPWWRVDLSNITVIVMVRIYSQVSWSGRVQGILLKLGTSLQTMVEVGCARSQLENVQNLVLPVNTEARFVELVHEGLGTFHICEAEVFGKIAECSFDPCKNEGACSKIHCDDLENCRNYTCACPAGYFGYNCETSECAENIAVGTQVNASSLYYTTWPPSNAVDGDNYQNLMYGGTCVSTKKEIQPYLTVDLGDEYTIITVMVFKRTDCCPDDNYAIEVLLWNSTWTVYGYTDGPFESVATFDIYPFVATRYVMVRAEAEQPVKLQLCEIAMFSICQEEFPVTTSVHETIEEHPMPYIQMRFSVSDTYSSVVRSEDSFIHLIREGLAIQTGYSEESFQNIQVDKDPFHVYFNLHATEGTMTTLNEMVEKIHALIRFGILEIQTENGELLAVTAKSLKYHVTYEENKGTRTDGIVMTAICVLVNILTYL